MEQTMEAAVLHAPGDLRVEQVNRPTDLEKDEVLVKIMATGICGANIGRVMETGTYSFPMIPGHEFCGVIEATGAEADHFKPGDNVAVSPLMPCFRCEPCQGGLYSLCDDYNFLGSRTDGGFAQYVKAPAKNVLKMPDDIDYQEGAALEPAAIILHGIHKVNLRTGDSVAVVGCGALGFFAVQFAKISGAYPVIAIDIDEEKLKLAKSVGADFCINASETDAVAAVKEIAQTRGVSLAIETAGNNIAREQCVKIVKKQGHVLIFGTAHKDVVFSPKVFEIIVRNEVIIEGSWNSYSVPFPGREWHDILDLLGNKKLQVNPLISHVFPLRDAPQVFQDILDRKLKSYNKIIFTPHT